MKTAFETATWRKSSYSHQGGDCLEVADGVPGALPVRDSKTPSGSHLLFTPAAWTAFVEGAAWRKSSYSHQAGDCLEVADGVPNLLPVRDSKRPSPTLLHTPTAWTPFLTAVKSGELPTP